MGTLHISIQESGNIDFKDLFKIIVGIFLVVMLFSIIGTLVGIFIEGRTFSEIWLGI